MKKTVFAPLCAFCIFLAACSGGNTSGGAENPQAAAKKDDGQTLAGFGRVQSKYKDYSLLLPESWEVEQHRKSASLRATAPHKHNGKPTDVRPSIVVLPMAGKVLFDKDQRKNVPQDVDLEEFAANHFSNVKKAGLNMETSGPAATTVNGLPAKCMEYTRKNNLDPQPIKTKVCITAKGHYAYILNFVSPQNEFDRDLPLFEQALGSFEVKD